MTPMLKMLKMQFTSLSTLNSILVVRDHGSWTIGGVTGEGTCLLLFLKLKVNRLA